VQGSGYACSADVAFCQLTGRISVKLGTRLIVTALVVAIIAAVWVNHSKAASMTHREKKAICTTFGSYCSQALRVAWCESRLHTWARNGQYLGLFQMGGYARSKYGHSSNANDQARYAFRYFVDSGRDWSPWSCKP